MVKKVYSKKELKDEIKMSLIKKDLMSDLFICFLAFNKKR